MRQVRTRSPTVQNPADYYEALRLSGGPARGTACYQFLSFDLFQAGANHPTPSNPARRLLLRSAAIGIGGRGPAAGAGAAGRAGARGARRGAGRAGRRGGAPRRGARRPRAGAGAGGGRRGGPRAAGWRSMSSANTPCTLPWAGPPASHAGGGC